MAAGAPVSAQREGRSCKLVLKRGGTTKQSFVPVGAGVFYLSGAAMQQVEAETEYASVYDRARLGLAGASMAAAVREWLAARDTHPARTLVLDATTGETAFALAGSIALHEHSAAMLALAAARTSDAGLDVTCWPTSSGEFPPGPFDLVLMPDAALNRLLDAPALASRLSQIAALLTDTGYFAASVRHRDTYARWDEQDSVLFDADDCLLYARRTFDYAQALATEQRTWFMRDDERWWRGSHTIHERAWTDAELADAYALGGLGACTELATPERLWIAQRRDSH